LAAQYGLELTAVRPCAIYGAFDPNFTAVFRRLAGLPVTVMPALMHLPLVYAGDVAEAIARALERPVSIGRAYNVTGDDATVWEFARAWRRRAGAARSSSCRSRFRGDVRTTSRGRARTSGGGTGPSWRRCARRSCSSGGPGQREPPAAPSRSRWRQKYTRQNGPTARQKRLITVSTAIAADG